jgi:hypothetical protein
MFLRYRTNKPAVKLVTLLFGLFLSGTSFSQNKDSSMLVFGDDFTLRVKEPDGWTGDIENARKYGANIIFYKSPKLKNDEPLVQVLAFEKHDEQTNKDLEADIASYKKDYPKAKLQDFDAKHKNYKCFSKLVYVDKNFYQYIVYINPGQKFKTGLSVAMNVSGRQATQEELRSLLSIISSLVILGK